VVAKRVLVILVSCQILRIFSFLSTQLPAPAPHCRAPEPTSNVPWPVVSRCAAARLLSCMPGAGGVYERVLRVRLPEHREHHLVRKAPMPPATGSSLCLYSSFTLKRALPCPALPYPALASLLPTPPCLPAAVVEGDHRERGAPGLQRLR
jgi:hypothetical protein